MLDFFMLSTFVGLRKRKLFFSLSLSLSFHVLALLSLLDKETQTGEKHSRPGRKTRSGQKEKKLALMKTA